MLALVFEKVLRTLSCLCALMQAFVYAFVRVSMLIYAFVYACVYILHYIHMYVYLCIIFILCRVIDINMQHSGAQAHNEYA